MDEHVLAGILIVTASMSVAATAYLWWVYLGSPTWSMLLRLRRRPALVRTSVRRSGLFRVLSISATALVMSGGLTFVPALRAAMDLPRFEYTAELITVALALGFAVPVYLAAWVWRLRRRAAHELPPRHVPPPGEFD